MSIRSKSKIFRLTELQLEQLEQHLEKEQTTFTDFILSLIQREIMKDAVTVRRPEEELQPRTKIKTVVEVVKRYQKTDPDLLLELSKIGNNLNQIARALNIIKNANPQEQRKLDIFSIFLVLKSIQTELEQVFPALPKISRQSTERLKKQLSSIQLAEQDESAY
ncbi:MAG: plasmid mobilization relaxosome protein MobC [Christensenellaceae bacterium]